MKHRVAIFFALLGTCAGTLGGRAAEPDWLVTGKNGVVASDSEYASRAGLEILQAGGNAIDAAVAVSFALGVTRPYSTGLGGGGFLVAYFRDGRILVQDCRETAPAAATRDMFARPSEASPGSPLPSLYGHLAVAVPGLLAGRCQALAQQGTMPLARVIAPAIRLAESGFPVDRHYLDSAEGVRTAYERYPQLKELCPYVYRTHLGNGELPPVGKILVQPELARLLAEIARHGPDFFYRGPVAKAIAREMKRHGGLVTEADLAAYRVRERKPLLSTYRGYGLIGMPPPSSGGIALAEALNILEAVDFPAVRRRDAGLAAHYQVEALKHAFADRARWLGDDDFVAVPTTRLTSKAYAQALAAQLRPSTKSDAESYGRMVIPDDAGTSHFCVVDRLGNAVSSTETINTSFGSLAAVAEWGLILNNEMDDFVSEPGKPNAYGLIQSPNNAIAPGKRPLSSMSPTIVVKDGSPYLLLGASGGPRIISSVLNVFLGVTEFSLPLEQAIMLPRPHHQWRPDLVYFDANPPAKLEQTLRQRGHQISDRRKTGIVQAILRTESGWNGASDPRKGGKPAGY